MDFRHHTSTVTTNATSTSATSRILPKRESEVALNCDFYLPAPSEHKTEPEFDMDLASLLGEKNIFGK